MAKDPYRYFRIEGREIVEGLGKAALDLEKRGAAREVVDHMLRLAHTLKGAARVVKVAAIAERAHALEDVLAPLRGGGGPPAGRTLEPLISELLGIIDDIGARLAYLGQKTPPPSGKSTPTAAAAAATAPSKTPVAAAAAAAAAS